MKDASIAKMIASIVSEAIFEWIDPAVLGLNFEHKEDSYTDFDRLKLLPYQQSDKGPATSIGDLNNDGMPVIYFGGSKHIPGEIFICSEGGFVKKNIQTILKDSIKADVDAVMVDLNSDGRLDLFIGTGEADYYGKPKPLLDSYYMSTNSGFVLQEVAGYYENASCVRAL